MVRVLDVDAREPNSPPNKSEILARTISTTTTGIAEVLGSNGCVGAASQKLRNRGHAVTRRTKLRCSPKRGYRLNIMEAFAHQQSGQPRVEIGARLCPLPITKVVLYKPSPGRGEELASPRRGAMGRGGGGVRGPPAAVRAMARRAGWEEKAKSISHTRISRDIVRGAATVRTLATLQSFDAGWTVPGQPRSS